MSTVHFVKSELEKLERALGRPVPLFECNADKSPRVKWSDESTHTASNRLPDPPAPVYGVPCKQAGLIVIDIDTEDVRRQQAIGSRFPETFTVKSGRHGGGYHLYYWDRDHKLRNDVDKNKERGFDVKTGAGKTGGYVVSPGSIHQTGRPYTVIKDLPIAELSYTDVETAKLWAHRIRFEGDGRNEALNTHLFRKRKHEGFDDEAIRAEADLYNQTYFIPPLDDEEIDTIVGSVLKEEPGVRGETIGAADVFEDYLADNPPMIQIAEQYYEWTGTHWSYFHSADLAVRIQDYILSRVDIRAAYRKKSLSSLISSVVMLVKRHSWRVFRENPFSKSSNDTRYINLTNGAWKLSRGDDPTWIERNVSNELTLQECFVDYCLPFGYDPDNLESPTFDRYLDDFATQIGGGQEVEEIKRFLLELMAYAIIPKRPRPYFLIIYGKQETGKSTFPRIIAELIGQESYLQRSMKHVASGRFAMADFLGKLVYVDDDLAEGTVIPGDLMKTISGETFATIERKNKDPFSARLSVFPILLSNTLPGHTGAEGLERRAIILEVARRFEGTPDLYLVDKIAGRVTGCKDERPAVFNKVLSAWHDLADRGFRFDFPRVVEASKRQLIQEGDTVSLFVHEHTDDEGEPVKQSGPVLYSLYQIWATQGGYRVMNRTNFFARLRSLGLEMQRTAKARCYIARWDKATASISDGSSLYDQVSGEM